MIKIRVWEMECKSVYDKTFKWRHENLRVTPFLYSVLGWVPGVRGEKVSMGENTAIHNQVKSCNNCFMGENLVSREGGLPNIFYFVADEHGEQK